MAFTLATAIRQVIQKGGLGLYIPNADLAVAAGAITSLNLLANANHTTNTWSGIETGVFRPTAATAADYWRYAGDLTRTTGALAVDRNYADTTLGSEDAYLFKYGITPQKMIAAANLAAGVTYFGNSEPLSLAADAGMQSTAMTSWVESDADSGPATTGSKYTTAGSGVFSGIGSMRVLNAAANGYMRQRFDVEPYSRVYAGALAKPGAFTAKLVFYDVTNGAVIGTPRSYTGQSWAYLEDTQTMPAGCTTLEIRLLGSETLADVKWNGLFVYLMEDLRITLSSTWQANEFSIPSLAYADFNRQLSSGVSTAHSLDLQEIPVTDYDFLFEGPAANPSAVQFHTDKYFGYPIYIQGRRAHSDILTFVISDLTQSIAADLNLFEAEMRLQLLNMGDVNSKVPNVDKLLQSAFWDRENARGSARNKLQTPAGKRSYGNMGFVGN